MQPRHVSVQLVAAAPVWGCGRNSEAACHRAAVLSVIADMQQRITLRCFGWYPVKHCAHRWLMWGHPGLRLRLFRGRGPYWRPLHECSAALRLQGLPLSSSPPLFVCFTLLFSVVVLSVLSTLSLFFSPFLFFYRSLFRGAVSLSLSLSDFYSSVSSYLYLVAPCSCPDHADYLDYVILPTALAWYVLGPLHALYRQP